jgi:hypothetical protein
MQQLLLLFTTCQFVKLTGKRHSRCVTISQDNCLNYGWVIMNKLVTIVVIVIQLFVGQILGFSLLFALGIGNGWELMAIPIAMTIGVWGVGALAAKLRGNFVSREYVVRLAGTAVAAALGIGLILMTPATGYNQLLYPLFGALLGFYIAPRIWQIA